MSGEIAYNGITLTSQQNILDAFAEHFASVVMIWIVLIVREDEVVRY